MSKKVVINPQPLSGNLTMMPSKSLSHRAVICATLAGNSVVKNVGLSRDIRCTIKAMEDLGYPSAHLQDTTFITNSNNRTIKNHREVYCEESGSTLRILIPQALDGTPTLFTGAPRLMERSMIVYEELFELHGMTLTCKPDGIFVQGNLSHGLFSMRGDVSSQFISGLLLALPTCRGDSILSLTTHIESKAYIDLTIDIMKRFGVDIEWANDQTIHVVGNHSFVPNNVTVEGDYSHAAFWIVGGILGDGVQLDSLNTNSLQGDSSIINIMREMGADISQASTGYCAKASKLKGTTIDISQTPDLFPILAVAAVFAEGETHLVNGVRLRDKECDRLAAMAKELDRLGVHVEESESSLTVYGIGDGYLPGDVTCQGYNDHRIVMSLAILASRCKKAITIMDAMSVAKSAPDFWSEYKQVGGQYSLKEGHA